MLKRLTTLGYAVAVIGLVFVVAGGVAFAQVQNGYGSLQKFSEAQNVTLSYNDDGQLVDRGEVAGAEAIMTLLTDDWGYPVVDADLDPGDPLVNTGSEYMFQMATIAYHVLHGTQTVTLDEPVEYNGETFDAGTYEVPVDGRYWTDFDRSHPLDGEVRELAWSGTAHGLIGELGVGTVTANVLQMGLGLAGIFAGVGFTLILAGLGLAWAARGQFESVRATDSSRRDPVLVN
jgi:hypothetical protein